MANYTSVRLVDQQAMTPALVNTEFEIPNLIVTKNNDFDLISEIQVGITIPVGGSGAEIYIVNVTPPVNSEIEVDLRAELENAGNPYSYYVSAGENKVTYSVSIKIFPSGSAPGVAQIEKYSISFTVYGVTNRYPLKPWTYEEVINRVLDLAKPLRAGETPQFSLDIGNSSVNRELFDEFAPEFTFTKMSLREALSQAGSGALHAEPRLHLNDDYTGRWTYEAYGKYERATYTKSNGTVANLNTIPYITNQRNHDIEQACDKLDSYIDNLVNRLEWEGSTISTPPTVSGFGSTLRTENLYVRIEEGDDVAYLPTQFPIDKIVKLSVVTHASNGAPKEYDITNYIFPYAIYNNLSSYSGGYPSSKCYALYYTQGDYNIKGFFFKPPSNFGGTVGQNYTIVNIMNASDVPADYIPSSIDGYLTVQFKLEYVPIYSARVQHSKVYLSDHLFAERTINYAQGSNSVETQFYGQHIKGVAQRLGNVEKYVTFYVSTFANIPQAGLLWDDEYYIATVNVSVDIERYAITCGLSKHFNRRSKYIGADSIKRIYEVSETQVQERNTLLEEYIVIEPLTGDNAGYTLSEYAGKDYGENYLTNWGIMSFFRVFVNPEDATDAQVAAFTLQGLNYNLQAVQNYTITVPCISSAFGNAITFTAECADNFSAGACVKKDTVERISGYFTEGTEYADYYGKIYYLRFAFGSGWLNDDEPAISQYEAQALAFPRDTLEKDLVYVAVSAGFNGNTTPLLYRKDSREKLKFGFRIEAVAGDDSFIIGSAIAEKNPLVTKKEFPQPHLYLCRNQINKFATKLENIGNSNYVKDLGVFNWGVSPDKYRASNGTQIVQEVADWGNVASAWAIAIPAYDGDTIMVSTERGEDEPFTPKYGGDILLARNFTITPGTTVGSFVAYAVRDLQKYIRDRRKDGKLDI